MNIRFDIEITPEELRRLMGLPDVQAFNEKVMNDMMEKLKAGTDGYDPMSIFQSSVMNNTDMLKQWAGMLSGFGGGSASGGKK